MEMNNKIQEESDMIYILTVNYTHLIPQNEDKIPDESDFESRLIKIPIGIFYPVQWMKSAIEHNLTFTNGICKNVTAIKRELTYISNSDWLRRLKYDSYIGLDSDSDDTFTYGPYDDEACCFLIESVKPISRKIYESELDYAFIKCDKCYYATINNCDRFYNNMLDFILKSIITIMLSMKQLGMPRDITVMIGKILWNTKHETIWINSNRLELNNDNLNNN